MINLKINKRGSTQKNEKIREDGFMPAVYYGRKEKTTSISVFKKDFLKVWKEAGESSVLILEGENGKLEALIQDVDLDPITSIPRHVDFYVVEKGRKIKVKVPIEFIGVSAGVKEQGGILVKVLHELEIEAIPKDLPRSVQIDISPLDVLGSRISAKNIKLPVGVSLITSLDEVVVAVSAPKEEKEEVAPVDLSAIEVEKKGKTPVEGEVAVGGTAGAVEKDGKKDGAKKETKK